MGGAPESPGPSAAMATPGNCPQPIGIVVAAQRWSKAKWRSIRWEPSFDWTLAPKAAGRILSPNKVNNDLVLLWEVAIKIPK